jgi:hypothetical protein
LSTSGREAWQKYFVGKGDIETTTKSDAPIFDLNGQVTGKRLPAHSTIMFLQTKSYEPKAKVVWNKQTIRIPFDTMVKPGVKHSGESSLKPQAFNVSDMLYSPDNYQKVILNSIEERKDLNAHTKAYLYTLVEYYGHTKSASNEAKVKKAFKGDLPVANINKDFGEVIGPLALFNFKLLEDHGIRLSSQTKIRVPVRPNEPLMDYELKDGDYNYIISAKSGTTTNTVKPPEIINLLKKQPNLYRKWKDKKEFAVIEALAEGTILSGPLKALLVLGHPNVNGRMVEEMEKASSNYGDGMNYNLDAFLPFIKSSPYLKEKFVPARKQRPTLNEIMYEAEKAVQDASKSKYDLTDIFKDAIKTFPIYVRFKLNRDGVGEWEVVTFKDLKARSVYLRSKNGYTRRSDKMGLQI